MQPTETPEEQQAPVTPSEPTESTTSPQPAQEAPAEPMAAPAPETPESPAAPAEVAPAVIAPADPVPAMTPETPAAPSDSPVVQMGGTKKPKRTMLFVSVIVLVILLLGGGYAFGIYLPNKPANVYKSSLKNSAAGIDTLTNYFQKQTGSDFKSVAYAGSLKVKSSAVSFDGNVSGKFDKDGNGDLLLNADVLGEKLAVNVRSLKAAGNSSPDIYLRATGIKSILDSEGLNGFDSLDGQWLFVDHTIIDSLSTSARQSLGQGAGSDAASASTVPSMAQINDAVNAVNKVNKQYLFTTDPQTAVLAGEKFIAKETKDGRSVDHFKVGYNKAHLKAYVAALKTALDGSQLNDWSKKANDGKSLSEVMDFTSLEDSVNNAKSDYTFDLWADTKIKLIHAIEFADTKNPNEKFTISQNYTGGSKYPFSISGTSVDSDGLKSSGTFGFTVDTATNKYTIDVSGSSSDGSSGALNLSLTPGSAAVKEVAPSGAKSINDLMSQFSSGDFFGTSSPDQLSI